MQRLIAQAIVIVTGSFAAGAFAQDIDSAGTSAAAAPNPVMTPDQFKTAVDNFSKQTKSNISQQVDQQTSYKPNAPAQTSASSSSSSSATSTSSSPSQQNPDTTSQPGATYNVGTQQKQAPTSSLKSTPPPSQTAAPNSQIYTGFGAPQPAQNNNTSGGQSKTNGTWNVGY